MNVVQVDIADVHRLIALESSFVVLCVGVWQYRQPSRLLDRVQSELQGLCEVLYQVIVNGSDGAEEFVVDGLRASALPVVARYERGRLQVVSVIDSTPSTRLDIALRFITPSPLKELSYTDRDGDRWIHTILRDQSLVGLARPLRLFISGDRSSVGKSSTCLALLAQLRASGIPANRLAYIKPATQCEAEQPIARYCRREGIAHRPIGPVVFFQGFTRAYLAGETDSSEVMLQQIVQSVEEIESGKLLVIIDGVGYPSVGSICNVSNGQVAKQLSAPVLLIGKSGVGDAVDSYNLNAAYFESFGVTVLGGIFNKISVSGFYNVTACREAVTSYFRQFKPHQMPFGFVPAIDTQPSASSSSSNTTTSSEEILDNLSWTAEFMKHVDLNRLVFCLWKANMRRNQQPVPRLSTVQSAPLVVAATELSDSRPQHVTTMSTVGVKRNRDDLEQQARSQGAAGG